jgi:hypothetical protein
MKPVARVILTLAAAAAAVALFATWRSRSEAAEARLERAQLKREFLERSSVGREIPPDREKDWREEARALTHWYFGEVQALRNRHPGDRPRPADASKKKTKEAEAAQAEFQKYAEERYALLRDDKYEPIRSLSDHGLRLDLLAFEPAANPATGERGIRIDFALWGAPRRVEKETQSGTTRTTTRVVVPVAFRQIAFQFLDEKGKAYGEMSGPGEPYQKIADPERFVEDFPPGILFGTWYVDLFPHQAARAVLTLSAEARGQSGADVVASWKFEMPVREEWRLPAGATYQAETREAQ